MIGDKIKQLRKQNSLSQDTFAEMIGVSRPTISRWERNDAIPDLDYLKRIADIFHIDLEELLKEDYPEVVAEIITGIPKDTDSQSEECGTYDDSKTKPQVADKNKLRVLSLLLVIALIVIVILVPAFIYVMIDRNVVSPDNMAKETDPENINGESESSSIVSDKFPGSFHLETEKVIFDIDKIEMHNVNRSQYKWVSKERDWDSEGLAKRLLSGTDCYLDDKDGVYYNKEYAEDHNSLTVQCCPNHRFFYHYHDPDKVDWRDIYYSEVKYADP